jgi:glutamyl-tRNA synthetase
MLLQGPSQAIVSLEWDIIWALNKKVIDPIAPRHWAILKDNQVPVTILGGPAVLEVKVLPKHKKNPAIGEKATVYTSAITIEQEDAISFDDQEEITLMDWGNAFVRSKTVGPSGDITAIEMELNLEGDFRKTKKKITWLAQPTATHLLIDVTLIDYDYLITKKKLEETDNVEDFVTPVTEFREEALADPNVRDVKKGDIIQFERKAFFVFDGEVDGKLEFIKIPDGKAASLASKAGVAAASTSADPASGKNAVASGFDIPVSTKMYEAAKVYEVDLKPSADTKMYGVRSIYDS